MVKRKKTTPKLKGKMREKLIVLFSIFIIALCVLIVWLMNINYTSGEKYEKKVLSMQSYGSKTLPYQRGDIIDRNGMILATSVDVYNVILDCSIMTSTVKEDGKEVQKYIEPTIQALLQCFPQLDEAELRQFVATSPDNQYIRLLKKLPYSDIQAFIQMQDAMIPDPQNPEKMIKENPDIKGVWFEKEYIRKYPFDELASSVIGFVSDGNVGTVGLENYYNSTLNGIDGREFGYLNSESDLERTVIVPEDGDNLIITIDANIQSVVEEKILEFNTAYTNNYRTGAGSLTTAVVVMNPNNGAVLAMAEYPTFDLNDPRDLTGYYSEEEIKSMSGEEKMNALNKIWKNFCVSDTYEPGSVQKPFTIAGGLETGKLNTGMSFVCDGFERISGSTIRCVNRSGHGVEDLEHSLMDSCNDALMQMSYILGVDTFTDYQSIFGFGQKTGIDLPGEAYTASLIYNAEDMKTIDLATNSFGQNYNCTMIQMASAFSSLINGGTYYQPYLVSKITDANGGTVSVTKPTVLKETVSKSTSDLIRKYLYSTVTDGTGSVAKVDGYSLGGKTGTAQKLPRGNGNYVVSFLGFAPYENPELVIYCVIDEPNSEDQPHSYYAQNIVREILEEVYPYMNIYPDEELTGVNADLDITGTDPYFTGTRDGDYLPRETSTTNEATPSSESPDESENPVESESPTNQDTPISEESPT